MSEFNKIDFKCLKILKIKKMDNWIWALREYTEAHNLYNSSLLKAFDGTLYRYEMQSYIAWTEAANSLRL
jgi:hypothetical protein